MTKDLRYYAGRFANLNVDRSRGISAPHKPILLLAVIELIEQGFIRGNRIYLSPELIAEFVKYWSQLGTQNHNADISLPFFHLPSEKFWHLKANPGFEPMISSKIKLKTIRTIQKVVHFAFLDDELYRLLLDEHSRTSLKTALVEAWFPDKSEQIKQISPADAFRAFQLRELEKGGEIYSSPDTDDETREVLRDAAFRRNVIAVYDRKCAFCGLRIVDSLSQNIVDGAHIKPFSKFFDNRIVNGLSLCKNHHWAFDRGWFAVTDDYGILVSSDLNEESPHAKPMRDFHRERIWLPQQQQYFPSLDSLAWHYENIFGQG